MKESDMFKSAALLLVIIFSLSTYAASENFRDEHLMLLPYPQEVRPLTGKLPIGQPYCVADDDFSETEKIAVESLNRYFPKNGRRLIVQLGSLEEGYKSYWLDEEQKSFLSKDSTSPEASILTITPNSITVVGKGKWGMLLGVQTINQLAVDAYRKGLDYIPCMNIRDWPDLKWRCLTPQLTWYSGWNRLEGYDCGNWSEGEWKWLVDWTLLHKMNAWAVCMYGYWPFRLPGYEETVLDVDSYYYNPKTKRKEKWRFTHPNIKDEFYPRVIRYANARGIKVHAYIGKNSFNGGYIRHHPKINAGGCAEMIPFAPGVDEYWDAFLGKILELGFDGFVLEDPEAYHVPNDNQQCYQKFWQPWEQTYDFSSIDETNENKPPLGVHFEYYAWLTKVFNEKIQNHARRLNISKPEIYLISHVLLRRMFEETSTLEERKKWIALLDEKIGCKLPFVIEEIRSREKEYMKFLDRERTASLGGRSGACTCAMRRIASVNSQLFLSDVAMERAAQRRICEAGGFGAMGYVFEWTNTEVFGYSAAQHLWHHSGIPYINNEDSVGFLDYAYRTYYGDEVGALVAKVMDEGSSINEFMILEEIHGSQYPATGDVFDRDFQYLAVLADNVVPLASQAYRMFSDGKEPDLYHPVYDQKKFKWDGYDSEADKLFKMERLRHLCVSTRRSQEMCNAALAFRRAQRLIAEKAPMKKILEQYDLSVKAAKANQLLYQMNYYDDYHRTDGTCSNVTSQLELLRGQFLLRSGVGSGKVLYSWTFNEPNNLLGWTRINHIEEPVIKDGMMVTKATGRNPFIIQTELLSVPVNDQSIIEVEIISDKKGYVKVYWSVMKDNESPPPFSEDESLQLFINPIDIKKRLIMPFALSRVGTLAHLRINIPPNANVKIGSIRIANVPTREELTEHSFNHLEKSVTKEVEKIVRNPLMISWEKQEDVLPDCKKEFKPGLYLSVDLGLNQKDEKFLTGVVFTVKAKQDNADTWNTLFRRAVDRRTIKWEHWNIPLKHAMEKSQDLQFRFITDSYARCVNRKVPSYRWALWGHPQLVRITEEGERQILYDFAENVDQAHRYVRLDSNGKDRPFDSLDKDSTGATFQCIEAEPDGKMKFPLPFEPTIAAFTPCRDNKFGITIAEYRISLKK